MKYVKIAGVVLAVIVFAILIRMWYNGVVNRSIEIGVQQERAAVIEAGIEQAEQQRETVREVERVVIEQRDVVRTVREKGIENVKIIYRDREPTCGISADGVLSIRETHSQLTAATSGQ